MSMKHTRVADPHYAATDNRPASTLCRNTMVLTTSLNCAFYTLRYIFNQQHSYAMQPCSWIHE